MLVRAGWIAVVLLVLGLVCASIPTYAAYLHLSRVSPGLAPADPGGQLTPTWGLSLNAYIAYLVMSNLLLVLSYLGMGTLIVWRTWGKNNDWMALCASYVLVTFPVNYQAGVGLNSMRERAIELGGTCAIGPVETGGTRIFIRLPLPKE